MAKKPTSSVARLIEAAKHASKPSSVLKTLNTLDRLDAIRAKAQEARELEFEIKGVEERLSELKSKLNELYAKTLPDMMEEVGVDTIGIPSKGNLPGYDYEICPYYSAGIASSWSEDKREEAFNVLKRYKAEDLIKTTVTAKLPKGNLQLARKLVAAAAKLKITTDINLSVHKNTLTAWLRELYEGGKALPQSDLEKISGSVGRIVRPKERKP